MQQTLQHLLKQLNFEQHVNITCISGDVGMETAL